jgi:hypothetical protein
MLIKSKLNVIKLKFKNINNLSVIYQIKFKFASRNFVLIKWNLLIRKFKLKILIFHYKIHNFNKPRIYKIIFIVLKHQTLGKHLWEVLFKSIVNFKKVETSPEKIHLIIMT